MDDLTELGRTSIQADPSRDARDLSGAANQGDSEDTVRSHAGGSDAARADAPLPFDAARDEPHSGDAAPEEPSAAGDDRASIAH